MKTAVVILNWNGRKFLQKFLPEVVKHSKGIADVVIADNASTDDSVAFMEKEFPEIRIIRLAGNFGFSKGYNEALKQIKAEYYVLLNSDIQVTENWIEPVIRMMDWDRSIGAVQPKILSFHEPDKFEYAGASGGFIDKYGYPFCRGRIFQYLENDTGQYDDTREIFWASGACMFVRADLYHQLEGLDNDFFAHMEEIDFCWGLKTMGYKIIFCPESVVYHVGGGTLPKSSSRKTYLNFRNNNYLIYKNLPSKRLIRVFITRYFLDAAASFKFLLEGGFRDFLAVLRAHASFWRNYGKMKKKRRKQKHIDVSCIYRSNIALDHYLKKITKFSDLDQKKFSK